MIVKDGTAGAAAAVDDNDDGGGAEAGVDAVDGEVIGEGATANVPGSARLDAAGATTPKYGGFWTAWECVALDEDEEEEEEERREEIKFFNSVSDPNSNSSVSPLPNSKHNTFLPFLVEYLTFSTRKINQGAEIRLCTALQLRFRDTKRSYEWYLCECATWSGKEMRIEAAKAATIHLHHTETEFPHAILPLMLTMSVLILVEMRRDIACLGIVVAHRSIRALLLTDANLVTSQMCVSALSKVIVRARSVHEVGPDAAGGISQS
jgi:hypothetical protein